ncbi:TPA: hypothetical protein PNO69_004524 [Salmonella enterica]|nr:hypothetical protein [Salmonella enterica]HCH9607967.1 hypothetical protein [Salmonella enterica]HDI5000261.1 hypothetical protein [Salmonella enterica]HDI5005082.1 hypothetical protein [Salmonella enterica]
MKQYMMTNLEQLKVTIDALIDAEEDVEFHCWDYSATTEEYQQECLDMLEFRKMQFESRVKFILSSYFKEGDS